MEIGSTETHEQIPTPFSEAPNPVEPVRDTPFSRDRPAIGACVLSHAQTRIKATTLLSYSKNSDILQNMNSHIRSYRGKVPQTGHRVYIDTAATVIGNVTLGNDVSVWPGAVIRGDMHWIKLGDRTNVQDNAVLHVTHAGPYNPDGFPLSIGEDVVIGHRAILHGCIVGNRVLIANGAIVNDGAVIPDETIIAAGCVIPPGKKLAGGYVYMGNPYQQRRTVTEDERRFFRYAPQAYVKLKDEYLDATNSSPP